MGKNPKKYRYLDIGLAWESWTLTQLEADAKMHQMDDQLAKLVALRLTEYYRLVALGIIVPGGTAALAPTSTQLAKPTMAAVQQRTAPVAALRNGSTPDAAEPEAISYDNTLEESDQAGANAAAALTYFQDAEEE